jgi:hypothetical protein
MLGKEDGFFESLTAICFLATSVLFFLKFCRDKSGNDFVFFRRKKNIFFLVLGIVFLLGFGEEISWGQRFFNLNTPEIIEQFNTQNEINFHNIIIFHGDNSEGLRKSSWALMLNTDRLFSLFWFTYCLLIPVLKRLYLSFSNWLKRVNLPIIPIWMGAFFMTNYVISKIMELYISSKMSHYLIEIKECNFSVLFLLVSVYLLHNRVKNASESDQK